MLQNIKKNIKNKAFKTWLIITIFVLVYLLFANQLIALFFVDVSMPEYVSEPHLPISSDTYSGIDSISLTSSFTQEVNIKGWAVSNNGENNDERYVEVFLFSGKKWYRVRALTVLRLDLQNTLTKINIMGRYNGFMVDFSMLNMDNGIYDIYMYVHENDTAFGLSATGRKIIKTSETIEEYKTGLVNNFDDMQSNEGIEYALDDFFENGTEYRLDGWGLIHGIPSDKVDSYLEFVNENGEKFTFSAFTTSRYDISGGFGADYLESGFRLAIQRGALPFGNYSVYYVAKTENMVYRSTDARQCFVSERDGIGIVR